MFKYIVASILVVASVSSFAADVTRISCGGINAVIVQHQPGSFVAMGATKFPLEESMDYYGPYCVEVEGVPHVAYFETSGNSYEAYFVGNTQTKRLYEISYEAAQEIGLASGIDSE